MAKRTVHSLQGTMVREPNQWGGPAFLKRRTLRRIFAAAVAIAAISPLFAADPNGCARGSIQNRTAQKTLPSQAAEHLPHH